ncbi:transglutaminase domain-containing protein [Lachnospiraceae bacterium 62-35]
MKKRVMLTAALLTAACSVPIWAGELRRDETGLWYQNEDGTRKTGWFQDEGGNWYYFDSNGYAKERWHSENGKTYYFRDGDGRMFADRTVTVDGHVYDFDKDGVSTRLSDRYSGWMRDDINWYYRMPDGYFVTDGWKEINGAWYCFDQSGYMRTGLIEDQGNMYYLEKNGAMLRNDSRVIGGVSYTFDETGACSWPYKPILAVPPENQKSASHKMADQMADQILTSIVNDSMTKRQKAEAIYQWVRGSLRYSGHSATRDWGEEAYQGLRRRHGDCYTYFSVSHELLTRCGIEGIEICRRNNGHYWNLIHLEDGWYHFDATPRRVGGYFCLWTDAQMLDYSARHNGCFDFDRSLYPPTP